MRTPRLTHVALPCADVAKSVDFYQRFAGLHLVHERTDEGTVVVWLSEAPDNPSFVVVLIGDPTTQAPARQSLARHLGYDVESRQAVDEIARRGEKEGVLLQGPVYAGPVVGYYCMLRDPDGNVIEFSYGQSVNPTALQT